MDQNLNNCRTSTVTHQAKNLLKSIICLEEIVLEVLAGNIQHTLSGG